MDKQQMGTFGERKAVELLLREGYRIIECNYRCKMGEIDVVAQNGGALVFCEVKTRSSDDFGRPAEAVTKKKQDHIRRVADFYLQTHDVDTSSVRFDVIEVYFGHIVDAF